MLSSLAAMAAANARRWRAAAPPRAIAEALLKKIAGASDGSLTIETAIRALPQLFKEWDKDGDGKLSREELCKGIDALTVVPSTEK